jgi:hypothetical protein
MAPLLHETSKHYAIAKYTYQNLHLAIGICQCYLYFNIQLLQRIEGFMYWYLYFTTNDFPRPIRFLLHHIIIQHSVEGAVSDKVFFTHTNIHLCKYWELIHTHDLSQP